MEASVDGLIFWDFGFIEPGAVDVSKQVVLGSGLLAKGRGVNAWGKFHPFILEDLGEANLSGPLSLYSFGCVHDSAKW